MPNLVANPETLIEIRQNFVELSGRYDLVSDAVAGNYADNGANFFISAGSRYLDNVQETPTEVKSYRKDIAANAHKLDVPNIRAITEVWATSSGGSRTQLTKRTQNYIRRTYDPVPGDNSVGTPVDWAPLFNTLGHDQKALTTFPNADFTYDGADVVFGFNEDQRSVALFPPADGAYTITVFGSFYNKLVADTDKNFWSVNYPDLLIMAARLAVEIQYRNSQGVNDMLGAMADQLRRLDYASLVVEESFGLNEVVEF